MMSRGDSLRLVSDTDRLKSWLSTDEAHGSGQEILLRTSSIPSNAEEDVYSVLGDIPSRESSGRGISRESSGRGICRESSGSYGSTGYVDLISNTRAVRQVLGHLSTSNDDSNHFDDDRVKLHRLVNQSTPVLTGIVAMVDDLIAYRMEGDEDFIMQTVLQISQEIARSGAIPELVHEQIAPSIRRFSDVTRNVVLSEIPVFRSEHATIYLSMMPSACKTFACRLGCYDQYIVSLTGKIWIEKYFLEFNQGVNECVDVEYDNSTLLLKNSKALEGFNLRMTDMLLLQSDRVVSVLGNSFSSMSSTTESVFIRVVLQNSPTEIPSLTSSLILKSIADVRPLLDSGCIGELLPLTGETKNAFVASTVGLIMNEKMNMMTNQRLIHMTSIYRQILFESLVAKLVALDDEIGLRKIKSLRKEDTVTIETIGNVLALWIYHGGSVRNAVHGKRKYQASDIVKNEGVEIYRRLCIYDGVNYFIRLNLFLDSSETFIHSHKTHFISMSLYGSYLHKTWVVDESIESEIFTNRIRDPSGVLSTGEQKKGRLQNISSFTHDPGCVYFLDRETLHSVHVLSTKKVGQDSRMLSFFVRDKLADTVPTRVADSGTEVKVLTSSENALPEQEIDQLARDIDSLLFHRSENMSLSNVFDVRCSPSLYCYYELTPSFTQSCRTSSLD